MTSSAKVRVPSGFVHGPLVQCFRRPVTSLQIRHATMPESHEIRSRGNMIYASGNDGTSMPDPVIHLTAASTAELDDFMRRLLIPRVMEQAAYDSGPAKWLDVIANKENEPLIDLGNESGYNFASWKLGQYALQLRFVGMQFAPIGLSSISKVWAQFKSDVNAGVDRTRRHELAEYFYGYLSKQAESIE